MAKNGFATRLQYLLQLTNTKSVTLASAVQYDLSYISKWLSGKMLPSEKNVEEVINNISNCLANTGSEKLAAVYGCSEELLIEKISADLHAAYDKSRPKDRENHIQAVKPITEVVQMIDQKVWHASSVIAVLDILSLPHENRLTLAGIRNGHFACENQVTEYAMVISLNSEDCVYDSVFLIHMLTSLSGMKFSLYNNAFAQGKLIYSMDDSALSAFIFPGSKDCLAVAEFGTADEIHQNIRTLVEQENLIFRKSTIDEMITHRDYIQTMISTNIRWILGHATELLLPQDVFEELAADVKVVGEYGKMYSLSQNILRNESTCVMIYESTMVNLAVDGELDFYNRKVKLKPDQILRCLDYYVNLTEMGAQIRLIDGGFADDFKYITNPCLFLSDSVCYLRLENYRYEDNILLLNDREVKNLFERFFDTVWEKRADVVTVDKSEIREKMKRYRATAEVLINGR